MNQNIKEEENLDQNNESPIGYDNRDLNESDHSDVSNGLEGDSEGSETESQNNKGLTKEEMLQSEIEKLQGEVNNFKDSWQRERAEFINYKRRASQELLNSKKEAVRNFIHELLHPMDNLELVTNVETKNLELKAFVDGIAMVKKDFLNVMEREGVKRMEPLGEVFDPMNMEAISSEESDEYKEEKVIEVYQSGYYYMDGDAKHSIRPARVKIGKPVS